MKSASAPLSWATSSRTAACRSRASAVSRRACRRPTTASTSGSWAATGVRACRLVRVRLRTIATVSASMLRAIPARLARCTI
ncbi:hypothetical protein [Paractinoplanes durhamensis]|uniref:hypothetical protein n=1 Tax=Paractinoplanes durhamensis TaxID=113563 RepID=UPI00363E78F4